MTSRRTFLLAATGGAAYAWGRQRKTTAYVHSTEITDLAGADDVARSTNLTIGVGEAPFDPRTWDFRPKSLGGTTGLVPGQALTSTSSTATTSGGVYIDRLFTSTADLIVTTATFQNCDFRGSVNIGNGQSASAKATIEDSDMVGPGQTSYGPGQTIRRCYIGKDVATNDGACPTLASTSQPSTWQPSLIEYNWLRQVNQVGSAHNDGSQIWAGGNITYQRNKFEWYFQQIILKSDYGLISNVTVAENLFLASPASPSDCLIVLDGAANTDPNAGPHGFPRYVTFTDNWFGEPWISKRKANSAFRVINWVNSTNRGSAVYCNSIADRDRGVAAGASSVSPDGTSRPAREWIVWSNNKYTDGVVALPDSTPISYP